MKGVIFNGLERIIVNHYGEDAWDGFLEQEGLEGVYTSLGNYDDAELMALVANAADWIGKDVADCLRWIGREMIPYFETLYPTAFSHYSGTIAMLSELNDVIHPEVTKLYPGATVPVFTYRDVQANRIVMQYESPRGLCSLAHGLMLGAGDRYGEHVEVDHSECKHRGDDRCLFTVKVGQSNE